MLLSKNTPDKILQYRVNYENEDARLLIQDCIKNYDTKIALRKRTQITVGVALLIREIVCSKRGYSFCITSENNFKYSQNKVAS